MLYFNEDTSNVVTNNWMAILNIDFNNIKIYQNLSLKFI